MWINNCTNRIQDVSIVETRDIDRKIVANRVEDAVLIARLILTAEAPETGVRDIRQDTIRKNAHDPVHRDHDVVFLLTVQTDGLTIVPILRIDVHSTVRDGCPIVRMTIRTETVPIRQDVLIRKDDVRIVNILLDTLSVPNLVRQENHNIRQDVPVIRKLITPKHCVPRRIRHVT